MSESYSIEKVNLAELHRITSISRAKLRRLKKNGFVVKPNGNKRKNSKKSVVSGYAGTIDDYLRRTSRILKIYLIIIDHQIHYWAKIGKAAFEAFVICLRVIGWDLEIYFVTLSIICFPVFLWLNLYSCSPKNSGRSIFLAPWYMPMILFLISPRIVFS